MNTDRELMQQALEALELLVNLPTEEALDYADNAIDALRERLAQPEQEQESVRDLLISAAAMAVVMLRNGTYKRASDVADAVLDREVVPQPDTKVNLQAIPKQISEPVFDCPRCGHCCPQPEQEPMAWGVFDGPNLHDVNFTEEDAQEMVRLKGDGSVVKPLYTSPQPQMQPCAGRNCGSTNTNLHSAECFEDYEKATGMSSVEHAVIAGALFDFMGWLTSRKERIVLSSADNASPAVEAITEFAKMRGLSLADAMVNDWQDMTRGNDAA